MRRAVISFYHTSKFSLTYKFGLHVDEKDLAKKHVLGVQNYCDERIQRIRSEQKARSTKVV
jgi:hypothetical protein